MKKFTLLLFIFLLPLLGMAQLAEEDFEGTWTDLAPGLGEGPAGPPGWYIRNVAGISKTWKKEATSTTYPAYGDVGNKAFLDRENVADGTTSEDWLITPQFNVPVNAQVHFFSRLSINGDQGSTYDVMIGTDPADPSTFISLIDADGWTELEINPTQQDYIEKVLDIPSSYEGQQVYIALVMRGDNFDRWLVDNFKVSSECIAPTNLTAGGITTTSANLSWGNPGGSTSWEVAVLEASAALNDTGVVYSGILPYNATNLNEDTDYKFYVRAICADGTSEWVGPYNFSTGNPGATCESAIDVAALPYSTTDNTSNYGDDYSNSPGSNCGSTSGYLGGDDVVYSYTAPSDGVISIDLTGVGTWTGIFVYDSCSDIGSNCLDGAVNGSTSNPLSIPLFSVTAGVTYYFVISTWPTPQSTAYTLTIQQVNCPPPSGLTAGNLTPFSADLSWDSNGSSSWEVAVQAQGAGIPSGAGVTSPSNTYSATTTLGGANLAPETTYEYYVRADCGDGTFSAWSGPYQFTTPPTCQQPANLVIETLTNTAVTYTWSGPSNAASYDYYFSTTNTAPTAVTTPTGNVTGPTATIASLVPSTTYYFWVRSHCSDTDQSTWTGPVNFTTPQVPADLNYTEDFEGTIAWTLVNSGQTNQWVLGTATSSSPTHSLYISNDNGVTNAYINTATTTVQAYRDIAVPAGTTDAALQFDWKAYGESCCDYLRVWLVPVTFTPTAGTQIGTGTNLVQIGGNRNVTSDWTTENDIIDLSPYAGATVRVVFEWHNDFSVGNNPAAIDNVNLAIITCPQPTALTANNITNSGATLEWTEVGSATNWEVYLVTAGSGAPTAATVGEDADSTSFPATDLNASTNYVYYVRAVCDTDDKSFWSGPYAFTTAIANDDCAGAVALTVNPDEDCDATTTVSFTGATPSAAAPCSGANGPDIWYSFTATSNAHGIALSNFGNSPTQQAIVISLYEGDNCGDLTLVSCSTINALNALNLTPGTNYVVRLTINAAAPNLATSFDICVNTLNGPSNQNQDACLITTINSDFEQPDVTGTFPLITSQNNVQGWRTTASDQQMEFWPSPNYENVPAYSGSQFIELNANLVSGVYQDYNTPAAGTVFSYGFAHRGRQGTDTCQLLAGPPGGPYVNVGSPVSTGNTAWSYNTGTYTVPAGQPITRFIFQSVSSSSTQPSVGNFLDAITFTANNGIITPSPLPLDCSTVIAQVQANGAGTWTAHADNPSATVIADTASNTTTISGFTQPGSYYYDWTTDFCTSTLEITYNAIAPDAPVVTDVTYCQDDATAQLTATALTGYTLNWYADATGGTPLAAAPTPDTSVSGTTTYYVSQQLNICESDRAAITVTVNPTPATPVTAPVEYCQDAVASPLTATTDGAGYTLNWYTVQAGGTALAATPTPDTATPGTTVYYVSQTSPEGCESDRAQLAVTVNPSLNPVTGFTLPASVCATGTLPLQKDAGFTTGGTYSSDTAGLVFNTTTGEIDLEASTPGQYTFTYTITADPANCITGSQTSVTFTITPSVAAVTGFTYNPATMCINGGNQSPVQDAGFNTGGTYTATPAGLSIDPASGEINAAASTANTYEVTYTYAGDTTNCIASGSSSFTVVIAPVPVVEFNYEDSYCFGAPNTTPALAPGFVTGGTFTATNGLSINAGTGEVNFAGSTSGVYSVTYEVTTPEGCSDSFTDTFTIGGDLSFTLDGNCNGSNYIVTATPQGDAFNQPGIVYQWTVNGAAAGTDSPEFDLTQYASLNNVSFPAQVILTVNSGDCDNPVLFEVADISCNIQRGISPNGDGMNDDFDLTTVGVKKISIFNRYGKEVYSRSNYTSEWHGQASNGDELPTGTYFYSFESNAGENVTGWIYINREVK